MNLVLTNELLIQQLYLGQPATRRILSYYRQQLFQSHQSCFQEIHQQFTSKLIFLNSVKHPGYIVFFDARKNKSRME